jgi:hypothetical protein
MTADDQKRSGEAGMLVGLGTVAVLMRTGNRTAS